MGPFDVLFFVEDNMGELLKGRTDLLSTGPLNNSCVIQKIIYFDTGIWVQNDNCKMLIRFKS